MKVSQLIFILFFIFFLATVVKGQEVYKSEFGFKSENDAFLAQGQDRYYTNGLFLYFRRAVNRTAQHANLAKKIWGVEVGQQMFNAQSGYVPNIDYVDRPFAGYLYGGASLQWLYFNESVIKASVNAGIVGPSSLAEEGQELYHHLFGFYRLNGWQYQVKDEPGLNLLLNYDRLLLKSANRTVDFISSSEARLGSTFSGLKTGLILRIGKLNPLYHSVATQSNVSVKKEEGTLPKEFYFFAKPSLSFVAYDATISGGLFNDDKGPKVYDVKPLVFSQQLGLAYSKNRLTVDFSLLFKTKEVQSTAKAHQYGILDIYYRFN